MKGICSTCGIMTDFLWQLPTGEVIVACSFYHAGERGELIDWNKFDGEEYRGKSLTKLMEEKGKEVMRCRMRS